MKPPFLSAVLTAALCGACAGGSERHIRVALGSRPFALDPHHSNEAVAYSIYFNVYEPLVRYDPGEPVVPLLAARWANPDEITWEFDLVPGVRFHDGSLLSSADVVFSLERARDDPDSAWRSALVDVARIEAPSASRVVLRTRRPQPTLLCSLADIAIVPKAHVESGHALETEPLGTGPYRFVSWDRGNGNVELRRSQRYWGQPPPLSGASFAAIPDDQARVDALRAGRVDLIADVPSDRIGELGAVAGLSVLKVQSQRELFLAFDSSRPRTPYASPERNPFLDRRVRLAFLRAIDAGRISREILKGLGEEATQLAAPRVFGYDPGYKKPAYDTAAARKLLEEARLGAGFSVTLDAPKGAYPADAEIARFVADSLGAVGVSVTVNLLEKTRLFQKLEGHDTSFYMLSWGATTGDMQEIFDSLLHTRDPARGYGSDNHGGFSDPEVDRLAEEASITVTPDIRHEILRTAVARAMAAVPIVPIYVQTSVYAIRAPFRWTPRPDKRIRIQDIEI